ncbi:U3 small nucleolar RNA-associated protein 18 homolog isoform X1 [Bacillus rossius redtenbacheri]|uniref:U3 small nucleolar RNA-associated protein 18 homolog isoform X1 n=1 Tax=Bacillus rossius redtenbacheri TaxID=93214 RepID=UPI002FDEAC43
MRKKRQAGSTPVEEKREEKRFRANSVQKKKKKKSTSPSKNKFLTLGVGDKDEVELGLEARVFGGVANVVERLAPDDARDSSDAEGGGDEGRAPAWQDEDDDISAETAFRMQGRRASAVRSATGGFSECLRKKFQAVVGTPEWAKLGRQRGSDSDAESDEDLLRRCGRFVVKKGSELGTGTIDIQRVRDLNVQTYAEGPIIKAVQFHPSSTVGLVAGMAGIVSLFQVDGHTNAKLHSIQFERFPIACARFTRDGNQFLAGSQKHRHLFYHDLLSGKTTKAVPFAPFSELSNMKNFEMSPDGRLMALCGRFGYVHVMTVRSRELVAKLKMDGEVTAVAFSPDGSRLYSHGGCKTAGVRRWWAGVRVGRGVARLRAPLHGRRLRARQQPGRVAVRPPAGLRLALGRREPVRHGGGRGPGRPAPAQGVPQPDHGRLGPAVRQLVAAAGGGLQREGERGQAGPPAESHGVLQLPAGEREGVPRAVPRLLPQQWLLGPRQQQERSAALQIEEFWKLLSIVCD